ncbi:hypothetical protein QVD17_06628 [Tagetes erecta]|uniref:Integrase catalytic domain-containing protein n=1 Tax=Tagetes erecta TaxID=13708 RepID=A0AAD8LKK0_TARER|nr:hypothetical protein QVD17_06628 [Tagetes erecta]
MTKDAEKKAEEVRVDSDSPYFIHASEYPRQMHVNDALTDNNYNDWSQEMTNFLFAKNKIGFIDGTIKKPEKTDSTYMQWMRCDAMIKGWLTTAMEKDIRNSVKYANTASDMWSDLKERFGKQSAPRAYELKQTLNNTRQDGSSVSAYYTRLRALWDEIQSVFPALRCSCSGCSCNVGKKLLEQKDKERVYEFLMGLDGEFSVIRTQILAMNPTPSLGTAYHLVAEDEQQRAISGGKKTNAEVAAFQAYTPNSSTQINKSTHRDSKRNQNDRSEHCDLCGRDGHNKEGCFKKIGYPEWWPGKGKRDKVKARAACVETNSSPIPGLSSEQYQALISHLAGKGSTLQNESQPEANMAGKTDQGNDWIIDSGCTEHITNRAEWLEGKVKSTFEPPVVIPNGDSIPVEGKGSCRLPNGTTIKGVLHVPKFKCNLLSVSRLSRDLYCSVTFFPDICFMQDLRSRELIGVGKHEHGLYRIGMVENKRRAMMSTVDLWHKRLGHTSSDKLSHFNFVENVSFKTFDCDSCAKAKHTRLPFKLSSTKSKECFELIHCDIWGRYRNPSLSGARYFLTIVDDYSRSVWTFLLKHKFEASDYLISFHKMIKTQFGKLIKRIRCDNGGEFTSNRMNDFYTEHGIVLETTCPHTPQQNGVVERKHRHLLETARALKFEANLPIHFWGECILTAAYIINRLPSKTINNKTPFEILFERKPDYEHMKVFGCLAYFRNTDTKGDKFELRGRPGVFLGYPPGTKGYKIYDTIHNKIIISRDVYFIENIFPYTGSKTIDSQENIKIFSFPPWYYKDANDVTQKVADKIEDPKMSKSLEDEHGVLNTNDTLQSESENGPTTNSEVHTQQNHQMENIFLPNEDGSHETSVNVNVENIEFESQQNCQTEGVNEIIGEGSDPIRQQRIKIRPKRLGDFVVDLPPSIDHALPTANQQPSTVHSLAHFISYNKFSNNHKAFLAAISSTDEPKTFKQAVQDENWRKAMEKEIRALEENGTWTLEELPEGKRAIDSKWVYKVKFKPNGEIERYKARLVARGFKQMEGVDFHDTFAPVAKLVTVRTLLAVAVKKDWIIHQLDVDNAFLHGDLNEEVYMKIPQGFDKGKENKVCRLRKSLYGLKQASRNWYQKFTLALLALGFKQSKADHSLFIYKEGTIFVAALIYVDDVIIVGNTPSKINETKDYLNKRFSIKDIGDLKYFLGIEVARTKEGLVLSQRKYTLDILEDCGVLGSRPSAFPMEQNLKLSKGDEEPRVDASQYRRLVGRLLYLQATRPDIVYSVNVLSQFVSDPRQSHMEAVTRVLRYLKMTPGQGILLSKEGGTNLVAYSDSDWLGCPYSRRSRTGYLLSLGNSPISWKSKKQSVVSRSSAEAEYRAMASTVSETLWMRWLLSELELIQDQPTPLFCDNQAARHIANNPVYHERTKHVEMDCFFVRERVESKEIQPKAIDTKVQIADLFTKALGSQQLHFLLGKLGVRDLHAPT